MVVKGGPGTSAPISWKPVDGFLGAGLAFDGPDTLQYLGPDELARWGVSFDQAFTAIRADRSDGLMVLPDATLISHRRRIVDLATRSRLPARSIWSTSASSSPSRCKARSGRASWCWR